MLPSIFSNNFFDDFFDFPVFSQKTPPMQLMRTDISENEQGYALAIDLPGYKKDELKLSVDKGYLTIEATKREDKKDERKEDANNVTYLRRERYYGSMSRTFYVGSEIKESDIKATFEDGILKLFVPKKSPEELDTRKYIAIS